MKSYIPLETAAILFLANLFLKQDISSEYVMVVSFAWANSGCKERKPKFKKMEKFFPIAGLEHTTPEFQV